MASIDRVARHGRNVWRVRAYINGKREAVYLGRFDEPEAILAKEHIEHLIDAQGRGRVPPRGTLKWLDSIIDTAKEIYDRLALLGLVEPRTIVESERTLLAYLRAYIRDRTDWKKPENYEQAVNKLETFLTKDVPLTALRRSDVERWHRWLIHDAGLSVNTAGQSVKRCRQIMNQALADRLIEENPFKGVRIDLRSDRSKNRYIDMDTTEAILDACPTQEWRVIIALGRYGGLRTPSESLNLRWCDIQWERGRFKVKSPKTERYGKAERIVPLFPELRRELEVLSEMKGPGIDIASDAFVIERYRSTEKNLRTQLHRIADTAGVERWPKPFMALRATRRTELERAGFKNHVLNEWFGHSREVAAEHYLQTTEADFAMAVAGEGCGQEEGVAVAPFVAPSGWIPGASVGGTENQKPNKKRALMALGGLLMALKIHPIGFEPITLGSEDRCAIQLRHGCVCGAVFCYHSPEFSG